MSISAVDNKNVLQRKIFFPELDTTVLLIAIPKNQTLTNTYKVTKQLISTSIDNHQQLLSEYSIFLITESSIFDTKILITLYEALKYKNICLIDDLLVHSQLTNVPECYLVTSQTAQELHCRSLLHLNRNLSCKEVTNRKFIQSQFISLCDKLWFYYRTCITHMFYVLKSNDNSYVDNTNRNYCICNLDNNDCNLEIQKFKIFLVLQTKHIQRYYNFQSNLFQSLTHRKKYWLCDTDRESDSQATSFNLESWRSLWNYHQIFFNTTPFTAKSFPKMSNLTSKRPNKETADCVKHSVSKIRRKLKGTLYDSTMQDDSKSANNSSSKVEGDKSQYNGMEVHKDLKKYWIKRYRLFSKFDEGIKLDYESWFSVTPEKIAIHIAKKCQGDIVIDAFCGAGGNSIQFAKSCQQVLSIDIDLQKLQMARHNAKIYGVDGKIDFILGNFFCLADHLIGDVVFLSPPWGGPKYVKKNVFDLKNIMEPYGGEKLLKTAQKISRNIAYYLPKNIDTTQLLRAAGSETRVEVEKNFLNDQVVAVTAYYGDLIDRTP